MKKLILIWSALIGEVMLVVPSAYASQVSLSICASSSELPTDARAITVYKVVQVGGRAWSTSPISAYYSQSENCIYVNEGKRSCQPYAVTENRAYGQAEDGRGEYRYTAGGYYFNL